VKIEIQAEILSAETGPTYMSDESCLDAISAAGVLAEISYGKWPAGVFGHVPCEKQNRQNTAGCGGNATIELVLYAAISQFARANTSRIKATARRL